MNLVLILFSVFSILLSVSVSSAGEGQSAFAILLQERQAFIDNLPDERKLDSFDYSSHINELEFNYEKARFIFELENVPVWGWDVGPYSLDSDLTILEKKAFTTVLGEKVYLTEKDKTKRYQRIRQGSSLILSGLEIGDMGWLNFVNINAIVQMRSKIYELSLAKILSPSDILPGGLLLRNIETGEEYQSEIYNGTQLIKIDERVYELGELLKTAHLSDFLQTATMRIYNPVLNKDAQIDVLRWELPKRNKYRWHFPFESYRESLAH